MLGLTVAAPTVYAAAKPLAGLSCQDGFFVRTPDSHIHWIQRDKNRKTEVYSQSHPVFAMAECGSGVISVFNTGHSGRDYFEAYYSANCLNIGSVTDKTELIYKGTSAITRIMEKESGVEIRLSDNIYLSANSCEALANN